MLKTWTSRYVSTGIHTSFVIICVKFDLEWLGTRWGSVGVGVQESRHAKCLPCSEQIWLAMRNPKSVVPACCSGEFPLPDFISFLSRPCFLVSLHKSIQIIGGAFQKDGPEKSSNQDLFLVYHPYLTSVRSNSWMAPSCAISVLGCFRDGREGILNITSQINLLIGISRGHDIHFTWKWDTVSTLRNKKYVKNTWAMTKIPISHPIILVDSVFQFLVTTCYNYPKQKKHWYNMIQPSTILYNNQSHRTNCLHGSTPCRSLFDPPSAKHCGSLRRAK